MYETFSYDDPSVVPLKARRHWRFMESNSAAAVMKAVCPNEWADIVKVLETYRLDPANWMKPGGDRGDVAEEIDNEFGKRGWQETRLPVNICSCVTTLLTALSGPSCPFISDRSRRSNSFNLWKRRQ
ncbi:MAG: hypothetical protein KDA56_09090 [Hyphomonas sp.]|nr:hypothetical protein [Hyphomonas sp.]